MSVTHEDVLSVVTNIWETILEESIIPEPQSDNWTTPNCLLGAISISGQWIGAVTVELSETTARDIAHRMFHADPATLDKNQICDALAELTNIVGGNIKSLMPGPSSLALPSVTTGEDFAHRLANATILCESCVRADGQPMRVRVWGKSQPATAA